ncbi:MAG: SprB repeat-containing protein [Saprospiraceae bacterium]|nr:SprB repeat-containing protein [Saprospiraceae bacterium]
MQAGSYSVTVTDDVNCTATAAASLTAPPDFVLNCAQQTPASSAGASDGVAAIAFSGGTAPYTYAWSGAASGSGSSPAPGSVALNSLLAGNYSLTLTDATLCTETCSFTITSCPLTVLTSSQPPTCNGSADGSIDLTVSGGTPPFILTEMTIRLTASKTPPA